jgi:hypothetical protein
MYFVTVSNKDQNDKQILIELRFFHIIYLLHDKSCYCSIIIYFKAKAYIYLMIRGKKIKNKYPRTIIFFFF